jgi:hypothetical protein
LVGTVLGAIVVGPEIASPPMHVDPPVLDVLRRLVGDRAPVELLRDVDSRMRARVEPPITANRT